MNRALRIVILMVGVVGTYLLATAPQVPTADGGPIMTCPQNTPKCTGMPPA